MPEKTSKEMYYLCFILMYTTFYTKVLSYFIKTTTRSIGFLKKVMKPVQEKIKLRM